jgi:hypothetical protein
LTGQYPKKSIFDNFFRFAQLFNTVLRFNFFDKIILSIWRTLWFIIWISAILKNIETSKITTLIIFFLENFVNSLKKIWCASWARVNLPHISNMKCIKLVLQRNLLKNTQGLSFFSLNLYWRYRWDVKYQNSECLFWFLDSKIVTKMPSDSSYSEISLTKLKFNPS